MTRIDLYHITEALESARVELEELQETEDWFVSDSLERIFIALQILRTIDAED